MATIHSCCKTFFGWIISPPSPFHLIDLAYKKKDWTWEGGGSLPVYPWSSSCLLPPSSPELLYSLGCSQVDLPGSYFKSFIAIQLPCNPFSCRADVTIVWLARKLETKRTYRRRDSRGNNEKGWHGGPEKDLNEGENIGFGGMGH